MPQEVRLLKLLELVLASGMVKGSPLAAGAAIVLVAVGTVGGYEARAGSATGIGVSAGSGTAARQLAIVRNGDAPCGFPPSGSLSPPLSVIGGAPSCPPPICSVAPAPTKSGSQVRGSPGPRPCRRTSIYVVGEDGRAPRRVALGTEPSWSPDGKQLAYTTGRFLAVQQPDRPASRNVIVATPSFSSQSISGPSWSPDGKKIVYSVSETTNVGTDSSWHEQLFSISTVELVIQQLTATLPGESDHSPAFSPSGDRIAYAHWGFEPSIWTMNAAGRDSRRLLTVDGYASGLTWSPDGTMIAFALAVRPFGSAHESGTYVVNADGSGLDLIASNASQSLTSYALDRPSWTTDGQYVTFTDRTSSGAMAAYGVRPDRTGRHLILIEPWSVWQPTWAP